MLSNDLESESFNFLFPLGDPSLDEKTLLLSL